MYQKGLFELLPPLSTDEQSALKADIKAHGVLTPIIVDEEGNILDGNHRAKIDPKAPRKVVKGLSPAEKKAFVFRCNFVRRNLSPDQKRAALVEMKIVAAELKAEDKRKWTDKRIGEALGVDRTTVSKWFISNVNDHKTDKPDARVKVTPETKPVIAARVAEGETQEQVAADYGVAQSTVAAIVKQEKAKQEADERNAEIESTDSPKPKTRYDVIVIDPPWPMQKIEREVRPNQARFDYPTMTIAEIAELELPAKRDCHVFIWTTHKFLPDALFLCESWGLKYCCLFTWCKPGGFQPVGLPQFASEFVVYARSGSPKFSDTKKFKTWFEAPRGKHSEKPSAFYELLARVTTGNRIDMFSRRQIDGFDAWGNEAKS